MEPALISSRQVIVLRVMVLQGVIIPLIKVHPAGLQSFSGVFFFINDQISEWQFSGQPVTVCHHNNTKYNHTTAYYHTSLLLNYV